MAILAFTNITADDQREYSCIIVDNNGRVTIHTIRVIVEEEGKLCKDCVTETCITTSCNAVCYNLCILTCYQIFVLAIPTWHL